MKNPNYLPEIPETAMGKNKKSTPIKTNKAYCDVSKPYHSFNVLDYYLYLSHSGHTDKEIIKNQRIIFLYKGGGL